MMASQGSILLSSMALLWFVLHLTSLCLLSNFWEIVREFTDMQKKQLLAFVTGSDRIPIGGLSKLRFVIVKNGPDSDR